MRLELASTIEFRAPSIEPTIEIASNDPLLAYLTSVGAAVDVDSLLLDSPAVLALRQANVKLVVPLISQGELIGMLNLGPRLSEQEFSADDRRLLNNLAAQAAPAVRVAQLVQEQEAEARERERYEQELRIAQLIQQQFLPRELPDLPGWAIAAHYQPARAVGGDFYDFIPLPDGQLGIVAGDVTDKGVPAALVMASTRSILRADAARLGSPSKVLERANELLYPDIPAHMFVTCLYAVLDPATGRLRFANAGHNLPYVRHAGGVMELRATGMPLGLMPGMTYDEHEAILKTGEAMLLYSDGLVEAHNADKEMFGFPRVAGLLLGARDGSSVIDLLMTELDLFTGGLTEQEDDITLVTLARSAGPLMIVPIATNDPTATSNDTARLLDEFEIPSLPGKELLAIERVTAAVADCVLPEEQLERLSTAVGEATMNAIEHGNNNAAEVPVCVRVLLADEKLLVQITDRGTARIPIVEAPDLEMKLAGRQSPRGWGLFLIQHMVDELRQTNDADSHTVELVMHLTRGDGDDEQDA
jgi:serine phosphatase RsbU (regulator of sigma subunit)/anti-sigma regulatory factor (Ser/Thr protein kinase)